MRENLHSIALMRLEPAGGLGPVEVEWQHASVSHHDPEEGTSALKGPKRGLKPAGEPVALAMAGQQVSERHQDPQVLGAEI